MNKKQITVLWVALVLIAAMGVVPPWQQHVKITLSDVDSLDTVHYSPIFKRPPSDFSKYPTQYRSSPEWTAALELKTQVSVDVVRLGVQWATVILVTICLLLILADRKARAQAPKERLSYLERMKRAGAGDDDVPEMALDDTDLTEDDGKKPPAPAHVFSDDEL